MAGHATADVTPGGPPIVGRPAGASVAPDRPLSWGAALYAAVVVTFVRPSLWAVALAGFLARGGLILVLAPILVLPTPSGLATVLAAPIASLLFGAPSTTLVVIIAGSIVGGVVLLVASTLVGAWSERAVVAASLEIGGEEGLVPAARTALRRGVGAVAVVRLLGLIPLAIALAAAADPLYDAIYHELVLPDEMSTSIFVRVLTDIPMPLLFIALNWLLGDAAAAIGVRRLLLEERSITAAWLLGWLWLVRRFYRVLPTALATVGLVALILTPAVLASATGWGRLRAVLVEGREPLAIIAGVALFVAVWLGGLVLAGAATTFRGAAWTFELTRRPGPSSPHP